MIREVWCVADVSNVCPSSEQTRFITLNFGRLKEILIIREGRLVKLLVGRKPSRFRENICVCFCFSILYMVTYGILVCHVLVATQPLWSLKSVLGCCKSNQIPFSLSPVYTAQTNPGCVNTTLFQTNPGRTWVSSVYTTN